MASSAIIPDAELTVNINWQGIPFPVVLPLNATVGRLKKQLSEFTSIPQEKIYLKTTWPPHNDETILASVDLSKEITVEERAPAVEEEAEDEPEFSQEALIQVLDSVPPKDFQNEFEEKYGKTHPKIFTGSCKDAMAASRKSMVPIILYLHSEKEESSSFCKTTLSSSALSSFIDKNYLFWVCHADEALIALISNFLGDAKFPILVVLGSTGGSAKLLELIQGDVSSSDIITKLSKLHSSFSANVAKAKQEQQERSEERMIIEEQDREFQESLERDKKRMKQKEIEEEQQRIEREKQEQERKLKEEEKLNKLKLLPNEPPQGSDTTTVVIKLPDGSRLQRRFLRTDTVELLYLFVDSKLPTGSASYDLVSNFPRKVFTDRAQTLQEGGLVPQGSLFISEHLK